MSLLFHNYQIIWMYLCVSMSTCILVRPSCNEDMDICQFDLTLAYNYTMTRWITDEDDGTIERFDPVFWTEADRTDVRQDCGRIPPLTPHEKETIQYGDGTYKRVILFNGQLPGPPIIVYEQQQVVVRVHNKLLDESTTVHWHGIRQHNTPWMDGAGFVSQCPILPSSSFTYRFLADPVGTHWYHSHQVAQRSMGAYGPLIVLPRTKSQPTKHSKYHEEHIMMISDWYNETSVEALNKLRNEFYNRPYWFGADTCYIPTRNVDGIETGMMPFYATMINGIGQGTHPTLFPPRAVFQVSHGHKHYFRVINTGMFFFFRISIDQHDLHVVGTDGSDVSDLVVESIIIGPGERYDFWIMCNDPTNINSYWIRVETTEYYYNTTLMKTHSVEGILRYKTGNTFPVSSRNTCTAANKCQVLNCPYKQYPEKDHIVCIPLTDLRDTKNREVLTSNKESFLEVFLKLQFTGANELGAFKPTINGILHRPHAVPPQTYPADGINHICDDTSYCNKDTCYCTHELQMPLNQVVQLVLYTHLPPRDAASVTGTAHTVHLHGHQFEVVKVGWPTYNQQGLYINNTADITCEDDDHEHSWTCHSPRWTQPHWGLELPGIISHGAPRKDTVTVPGGGYVVIRFRTDNPGYWLLHCHMEVHNEMGMALVLRTGNVSQMNRLPQNFPQCGSFTWSAKDFDNLYRH